jgi:hypothetical protein
MRSLTILIFGFMLLLLNVCYGNVEFTEEVPTNVEKSAAKKFFNDFQEKLNKNDWKSIRGMIYTDGVKEKSEYTQTPDDIEDLFRNNQPIISRSQIWKIKVLNFSIFDDRSKCAVGSGEVNRKGKYISLYLEYNNKKFSKVKIPDINTIRPNVVKTQAYVVKTRPYIELRLIPVNMPSDKIIYKIFELRIIKDGTIMINTDKC